MLIARPRLHDMSASRRLPSVLLLAVVASTACITSRDDAPGSAAAELLVRPAAVSLRAGETVQLTAQINDALGRPVGAAPLAFATLPTSIVSVSPQGLISATGVAGRDSVTISSGSLRRTVAVAVAAGRPSAVDVSGGAQQSGLVGSVLTEPVLVTVRDAYGNAVARSAVRFNVESGGSAVPANVFTDASGHARALWTLGPLAGAQVLSVVADSASATVEAIARAGTMARVAALEPAARRTTAGDTVAVQLRALDAFGNGAEGVVFAFSVESGGGDVAPPRMESDSTGFVQTHWRTGTVAGANTLRVRAIQERDTSFQLLVRTSGGEPAAVKLVSGDGQRAAVGTAVRRPPVVRVVDRYGNAVSAVHVRFLATSPSEVQPQELVTNDRGEASPREWKLGVAGEQLLLVVAQGARDTVRVRARALAR